MALLPCIQSPFWGKLTRSPSLLGLGLVEYPLLALFSQLHIFTAEHWLKIYMDDLSIHTQGDLTLHHEHTQHVLIRLHEHSLSLKLSKCLFDAPKMEFLGMIIGQGQIAMDPVKLTAIHDWKPPTSVKGICSFLGFANFYCKFSPNVSYVVTPLNLLTQKDQPWN